PAGAVAGQPFSVTLTALDAGGNRVGAFSGLVDIAPITGAALPPSVLLVNGSASFQAVLTVAGPASLQASSGAVTGSAVVSVTPGAAFKLAFVQQPQNGILNVPLTPAVTVAVQDRFGNVLGLDN